MTSSTQLSVPSQASINGIAVRCPRCLATMETVEGTVHDLVCSACPFSMEWRNGIWHALPAERKAHYAQFTKDYEMIRAAEGRGSHTSEYYLGLPYVDHSGNNRAQWRIRARTFAFLRKKFFSSFKLDEHDSLRVLDIGAGTGWLCYRLGQMGIQSVAIDLLINEADGLGAAVHYDQHLDEPFIRVQAESTCLPFLDGQFDAVIFNASFHYAESYEKSLRESLRCLRPGGIVIVADSPWYSSEKNGEQMLAERRSHFFDRFGTFSNSIQSQEFLTDERLGQIEVALDIKWERHRPFYGIRWALRPWVAKLRNRREPAIFRVYTARKPS